MFYFRIKAVFSDYKTNFKEKFENTEGVTRRHTSINRQYNGQKKVKRTNNDLQNTTQKTKIIKHVRK
jgi:hypothetical protein